MNINDIRTLYAYNRWANRRLLAAVRLLAFQEFTKDLGTSHASLRGTLVHILWAEWIWLMRWRGESPKQVFNPEEFPDATAVESRWTSVERGQRELIASLSDETLNAIVSYENLQAECWEYSLAHMMQHVVNHSSYHRGQMTTLLRQLGHVPPTTDFLVFFDEGQPATPPGMADGE